MSSVSLPVALPLGTDEASAQWRELTPTGFIGGPTNPTDCLWTVPAGEVWLVSTVTGKITSVAPGTTNTYVQITNQNNQIVWWDEDGRNITAPQIYWQSAAIFYQESTPATSNLSATGMGLPLMVLPPGYTLDLGVILSGAGSAFFSPPNVFAQVTWWTYGSSSSGGTDQLQVGPALYVPGPTGEQAAA